MRNIYFIFALFLFSTFSGFAQYTVETKITIKNTQNEIFDKIRFGIHRYATDGLDTAMGERDYPGAPPTGMGAYIYVVNPVTLERMNSYVNYLALPNDYTKPSIFKIWLYNNSAMNHTLSWSKLPDTIDSAYIYDDTPYELITINMKDSTKADIIGPKASIEKYKISVWYRNPASSVEDAENNNAVIYPNPAEEFLKIKNSYFTSFELVSFVGSRILKGSIVPGENMINIKGIASGFYILRLIDQSGNVLSKQFIKQ